MIVQSANALEVRHARWLAASGAAAVLLLAACSRPREAAPDPRGFTCQAPPPSNKDSFGGAMQTAMARMNTAMSAAPSADPDRDFATMMIPHHRGAVDMALAELRFGKDERLRRLAAGIIVEQRSEIALMQQILDEPRAASVPAQSQPPPVAELAAQVGEPQ